MYCNLCKKLKVHNSFTKGCHSIRLFRIREHEVEKQHVFAVEQASRGSQQWEIAKKNVLIKEKTGVLNCIKMAYSLAKQDVPLAKFPAFLSCFENFYISDNLQETLNVGVDEYRTRLVAREFAVICLAEVLRDNILDDVRSSPAYTVGVDESTDISTVEEMVLYCWYLLNGVPVVRFLGLYGMPKADAATITTTIQEKLLAYGLDESKLFAFGSDGASVMTGCESGVGVRLRSNMPCLLYFHCLAHRLALSSKDAAGDIGFFENFDTTLHSISTYFARAGLRKHNFIQIQEALGFDTVTGILKDVETRWLSKGASVDSIYNTLPALVEEFQNSDSDVAKALLSAVTSLDFIGTLCFYKDILHRLNLLSKCFQADVIDFEVAADLVQGTRVSLEAFYINCQRPGGTTLKGLIQQLQKVEEGETTLHYVHHRGTLDIVNIEQANVDALYMHVKMFATSLHAELGERYPDQPMMSALDIFSPRRFPRDSTLLEDYENDKLQTLIDHYSEEHRGYEFDAPLLDADRVMEQWDTLKTVMFAAKIWEKSFSNFWTPYLSSPSTQYEDITFLVSIRCILPLTTACCERGFSKMKIIKTYLRNRLMDSTLSALMMCSLNGPELSDKVAVNELCYQAYLKWSALKCRTSQRSSATSRPKQHYKGKKVSGKLSVADSTTIIASGLLDGEDEVVEAEIAEMMASACSTGRSIYICR